MAGLKKLNDEQLSFFFEQLWLMINSGMRFSDGLDILVEESENGVIAALSRKLSDRIDEGATLALAMEESGVFPRYSVRMIEIGEMTGKLDETLKGLSEYYESRSDMNRTVRYAVFHPTMLLVMMTVVMIVMVVKIIPMFAEIFSQFDSEIGSSVDSIVSVAYTTGNIVLIVLVALIVILGAVVLIPPLRKAVVKATSVFPLTSGISRKMAQAKFADAMSMMITGGVEPEEALEYAAGLVDNKKLTAQVNDCLSGMRKGEFFSEAVAQSEVLPKIYARSLRIAYTSGSFDVVWRKISRRCNEEAQKTISNLLSLIEPAIVLLLAVTIGAVLISIMLPLVNIMSALG